MRRLGFASYRDYLRSPHWLGLRRTYRVSSLPQVCVCGDEDVQLHHLTYERVGAERLTDLTPLCRGCHALVHVLEYRGDIGLNLDGLCDEARALGARAWLASEVERRRREAVERAAAERAHVLSLSFAARLLRARRVLKARHIDASHDIHIIRSMVKRAAPDGSLTRRLRFLEARAYGWDDWI